MMTTINHYLKMSALLLMAMTATAAAAQELETEEEDGSDNVTREIFIYSPDPTQGLHAAYMDFDGLWQEVGQLCASDYGRWGSEKRMYAPNVVHAADGTWRAVWQVNSVSPCFAAAYSEDLITWRPQDYPRVTTKTCLRPIVFEGEDGSYDIFFQSGDEKRYLTASKDFRTFTADTPSTISEVAWGNDTATVGGKRFAGQIFDITQGELVDLLTYHELLRRDAELNKERMTDDAQRYKNLSMAQVKLVVDEKKQKAISDRLIGVFFEDISYAADGGLYAEMVQNRDFEYCSKDRKEWTATTAWSSEGPIATATEQPLSENNPHHALLTDRAIANEGWDGMVVQAGSVYHLSLYARCTDCEKKTLVVALTAEGETKPLAEVKVKVEGSAWRQYTATLTPKKGSGHARLQVTPQKKGTAAVDLISLFPQDTFKGRKNGLRKDLAQAIADLKPKFVRFPGGCMSHGDGIDNIYHWHHTVGPLQDRKPDFNIWHYHQTRGLGFYEYFQFCEDIGAEPLPVLAAGVPCQNSGNNTDGWGGQQGGIPMADMPAYCEEILNLIEWANGDPATSPWAKMRADAGHPAPFGLKTIGIGNEDIISSVFEERYLMICKAVKEKYPDIEVCGTVGPFHAPSADYIEGWDFAEKHKDVIDLVDEHYYESTGWFLNHRRYYNDYDRQGPKVYLGEWAASTPEKRPNVETALAESIYLTDIERNADVVTMTSYAPLLCKDGHANWNPDMIYFSNTEVRTTPAYEVQRLFATYSGNRHIDSTTEGDDTVTHRVGASVVDDTKTGHRYLKIANALPVPLTVNVEGMALPEEMSYEGFAGQPAEQQVSTEKGSCHGGALTLPPYSLRIFVVK